MAGEWETVPLECLLEADRGISYGIVQPGSPVADGVPIVRVSDVRDGRISTANPLRVSRDIESAYSRTRLKGGELLLTLVGTVGEAAVVPGSLAGWNTARAVAVIPVREEIGAYWVQVALRAPQVRERIDSRLNTTVQVTLNLGDVAQLPIVLPPRREREVIAHILGTLDDKIELNRRMNQTLEAMARALFQSWFVDFDPVRAKVEGRDPGLPKEIADLFPGRLEDSELGEIPAGWEIETLGELLELAYGKALKADTREHGDVPVYGSNGQVGWHDERLVAGPGVVVGRKGNPGTVTWSPTDFFPIDTTFYVVPKRRCPSLHFLFHALKKHDLAALGADSAVPGLNRNLAYMSKQVVPPEPILGMYDQRVHGLAERIHQSNEQSRTLSALRDTLLPKLISGELRVKHAEDLDTARL